MMIFSLPLFFQVWTLALPALQSFCFQHLYTRRRQTLFDRASSPPSPGCSNSSPKEKSAPDTKERRLPPPPQKKRGPLHTQSALASNNAFPPISGTQQHPISPHIYPQARAEITILFYGPACCYVCALRQDILFEMHPAGIALYSRTILTAVSPREIFWIQCLKQIGSDSARVATKRTFFIFAAAVKKKRTCNRKKNYLP